jgi:hypothetical protein
MSMDSYGAGTVVARAKQIYICSSSKNEFLVA